MSGLTKIKDRILGEAREKAEEKLKAAREEAGRIKSEAVRESDHIAEGIMTDTDKKVKAMDERGVSAMELERRMRVLDAKQEMIAGVLDEAREKILSLEPKEYFGVILKLIEKNAGEGEGTIVFSGKDLERMPEGFQKEVDKLAQEKGGKLTVSKEPADIGPGFILSYGGIEENCTFDALFQERKEDLSDIVKTILFS